MNISGSNFTAATAVLFGGVPAASYTVNSDSSITAVAPPQAAGTVDIKVVTYSGDSASTSDDEFTYTSASSPTVTYLDVSSGSTAGGTTVTLTGSNFTGATGVSFGSVWAAFTINSDSSITAVAPPQAAGTVDITVTTYAGTSATSSADQFSYSAAASPSVSGLDVTSGGASGGNAVTIYGSGFTAASIVNFGSVAAADFTVLSDNAITAVAPPQSPGSPIDITVTTPSGTSATSGADQYTYNADSAPTVTGIDTSSGSTGGGTVVNLTGTNFLNASGVSFGGVAASFLIVSATTIQATAPPQTAGPLDITVSNDGGTSALSGADRFTYVAASAPAVTGVSTMYVSTDGTTTLAITGTNLLGTDAINFGSVAATTWSVNSDTSITVTAPIQSAGTVDITVSTPSGTSATSSADQVTYVNASVPTVSAVSPNSGSASAGTTVTITGSNFLGTTAVYVGTMAADFNVVSATQITATVPQQAPSDPVDVTVQSASGTSSTSSGDLFTYSSVSGPTVSALLATGGSTLGGDTITVIGTGFLDGTSAVNFGSVASSYFTVLSDTALTAVAPAGSAGTVDVTVTNLGGPSATSSADLYTYATATTPSVSGLGTPSGDTSGGTVVVINGSDFTSDATVNFGSVAASQVFVNSSSQITAVAPAQSAGTIDVTVTNGAGTSSTSSADQYEYTTGSAPSVTSVSPDAGPLAGGNTVTINGANLQGVTGVKFGSTAATGFSVNPDGSLFATAPAGSAVTVDVTVTTYNGTSSPSSADQYSYVAAPTLTSLNLTSGSPSGGWSINLTGTNFSTATEVWFGTVLASFTINSDTSITAITPAEPAGTVSVTVVTAGGTSNSQSFTFADPSADTVVWIGPNSGGDWDTASNWSDDAVPTSTDNVMIGSGVTVTHNSDIDDSVNSLNCAGILSIGAGELDLATASSIANLILSNAGLGGAGNVEIQDSMDWNGGFMSGSGTTTIDASATLTLGSEPDGEIHLERNLINAGSVVWTGDYLIFGDGVTLDNQEDATFDDQTDLGCYASGWASFSNEGTFTKSSDSYTTSFYASIAFSNSGTLSIDSGSLTVDDLSNSGEVDVNSGTLSVQDGSNSGSIVFASDTSLYVSSSGSAAFILEADGSLSGSTVVTVDSSGVLQLDQDTTLDSLTLNSGGLVEGAGNLTIAVSMDWTGGTVSGTLTIDASATLTLENSEHDLNSNLNNAGSAVWTGGDIVLGDGVTFDNQAGATFDNQADTYCYASSGSAAFSNEGTFTKSGGSSSTLFDASIALDNSGTIEVQSATLQLEAGSNSGSIVISAGAVLQFDSSSGFTLDSGSDISGAGSVLVDSGMLYLCGTLDVGGGVTISSLAVATLDDGGNPALGNTINSALVNQGTIYWTDGYIYLGDGASIDNQAGATFNDEAQNAISVTSGSASITNEGSWLVSAAVASSSIGANISFSNSGGLSVLSGTLNIASLTNTGTVTIDSLLVVNVGGNSDTIAFADGGSLQVSSSGSGVFELETGTVLSGTSVIAVTSSGVLQLDQDTTLDSLTVNTDGLVDGAGNLTIDVSMDWTGGTMSGAGTTTIDASASLTLETNGHDLYRNLNNAGSAVWTGGNLVIGPGLTLDNQTGASFDIQGDTYCDPVGGSAIFSNEGTLTASSAASGTIFDASVSLHNSGTFEVQTDAIQLQAGFNSGSIVVSTGAVLQFAGTYTLDSDSDISGDGSVLVDSGTLYLGGTLERGRRPDHRLGRHGRRDRQHHGRCDQQRHADGRQQHHSGQHQHQRQLHPGQRRHHERDPGRPDGRQWLLPAVHQRHRHPGRQPEPEPGRQLHPQQRRYLPGADLCLLQRHLRHHQRSAQHLLDSLLQ